jgi:hypothetical protein
MRRLGAAKAASHAEAAAAHLALGIEERLRRSWMLYVQGRGSTSRTDEDDPSPFYEAARARNLYRP